MTKFATEIAFYVSAMSTRVFSMICLSKTHTHPAHSYHYGASRNVCEGVQPGPTELSGHDGVQRHPRTHSDLPLALVVLVPESHYHHDQRTRISIGGFDIRACNVF